MFDACRLLSSGVMIVFVVCCWLIVEYAWLPGYVFELSFSLLLLVLVLVSG